MDYFPPEKINIQIDKWISQNGDADVEIKKAKSEFLAKET